VIRLYEALDRAYNDGYRGGKAVGFWEGMMDVWDHVEKAYNHGYRVGMVAGFWLGLGLGVATSAFVVSLLTGP
jgi:ribosome modulation factor